MTSIDNDGLFSYKSPKIIYSFHEDKTFAMSLHEHLILLGIGYCSLAN